MKYDELVKALRETSMDFGELDDVSVMLLDAAAAIEELQAEVPHWVSVEDEIPEDGEWAIFTNGKVITVERLKHDAYDHFYPPSKWFNFEDATYWMPLPEPPKEEA